MRIKCQRLVHGNERMVECDSSIENRRRCMTVRGYVGVLRWLFLEYVVFVVNSGFRLCRISNGNFHRHKTPPRAVMHRIAK